MLYVDVETTVIVVRQYENRITCGPNDTDAMRGLFKKSECILLYLLLFLLSFT